MPSHRIGGSRRCHWLTVHQGFVTLCVSSAQLHVDRSNLVDMAHDTSIQFGEAPPLFAKPPDWLEDDAAAAVRQVNMSSPNFCSGYHNCLSDVFALELRPPCLHASMSRHLRLTQLEGCFPTTSQQHAGCRLRSAPGPGQAAAQSTKRCTQHGERSNCWSPSVLQGLLLVAFAHMHVCNCRRH